MKALKKSLEQYTQTTRVLFCAYDKVFFVFVACCSLNETRFTVNLSLDIHSRHSSIFSRLYSCVILIGREFDMFASIYA